MKFQKKILLITTGGTIAGESISRVKNHIVSFHDGILNSLKKVECQTDTEILLTAFELCKVDSSDISPLHWTAIGDKIYELYDEYDVFLITHGTNTLAYTAAALSFSFENLKKPIILTGSQIPYGNVGSDALMNVENSLRIAVMEKPVIQGVFVVFGSYVLSGVRAKKMTEFDYDAFKNENVSSIGRIGRKVLIDTNNLKKHKSYLKLNSKSLQESAYTHIVKKNVFDLHIISLTEFPGMSSNTLKKIIEENDIKGVILRAFGAGDVSNNLEEALQYLKDKKIPVVITSQAPNGVSNFQVNKPGERLFKNKLGIPAWDMSIESQTVKLSWLLGQECSYEEIIEKMLFDFRGEINVK